MEMDVNDNRKENVCLVEYLEISVTRSPVVKCQGFFFVFKGFFSPDAIAWAYLAVFCKAECSASSSFYLKGEGL